MRLASFLDAVSVVSGMLSPGDPRIFPQKKNTLFQVFSLRCNMAGYAPGYGADPTVRLSFLLPDAGAVFEALTSQVEI